MKGSYILLLKIPDEREIWIGKLGLINFPKSFYAYVGSAMKGFESRIGRHLRKNKKPRWHIDYLLEKAEVSEVILFPEKKLECVLAQELAGTFPTIPGFGSSDCHCRSHLYFSQDGKELKARILKVTCQQGLDYHIIPKIFGKSWRQKMNSFPFCVSVDHKVNKIKGGSRHGNEKVYTLAGRGYVDRISRRIP